MKQSTIQINEGDTFRLTKMVFRNNDPPVLPGTVFRIKRKVPEYNGVDLISVGGLYELKVSLEYFKTVFQPYP